MIFTAKATELLKRLEGLRLEAYQDEAGVWTIGYGHTGRDVTPGLKWTQEQADKALYTDVNTFVNGVLNLVGNAPLNDSQFSALVIFAYNVGLRAFLGSTLRRHVNVGSHEKVPGELRKWCHVHAPDGSLRVSPGLLKRREAEINLWLSAE